MAPLVNSSCFSFRFPQCGLLTVLTLLMVIASNQFVQVYSWSRSRPRRVFDVA